MPSDIPFGGEEIRNAMGKLDSADEAIPHGFVGIACLGGGSIFTKRGYDCACGASEIVVEKPPQVDLFLYVLQPALHRFETLVVELVPHRDCFTRGPKSVGEQVLDAFEIRRRFGEEVRDSVACSSGKGSGCGDHISYPCVE
ncbi:MAG: hypothetical protein KDK53_16840 [Maritimibacter sp.]|nr:hypothetical protein [Maritimibacter sp.]